MHDLILGALQEFKNSTEKRLDQIEVKVDALNEFKWRMAGGAALLSVILTALVELVRK